MQDVVRNPRLSEVIFLSVMVVVGVWVIATCVKVAFSDRSTVTQQERWRKLRKAFWDCMAALFCLVAFYAVSGFENMMIRYADFFARTGELWWFVFMLAMALPIVAALVWFVAVIHLVYRPSETAFCRESGYSPGTVDLRWRRLHLLLRPWKLILR